ncbi:extracellular solute-binding protein [Paraburkholderia strydomiana]|uniref:extracellular solute-binding protein n=1 Tax=Paraburkholderia strydomiana TaxID=1245417 RepID=UPI0028606851|nr:extracellular solute-binding protein [Paraburkholderia strydomiana]MDR7009657.1 multiple sugar transport system substrate-binding protein [Paraburkholderia strydomiana]
MNDYEILRIIEFVERSRTSFRDSILGVDPDADWLILSHLVRAGLRGEKVSISELISISRLPYGTANRRIQRMINEGLIAKQAIEGSKRFDLIPTAGLHDSFLSFAQEIKVLVARTLGMRGDAERADDYFFGDPRANIAEMLPPPTLRGGLGGQIPVANLRFLFHDDNYFASLRNLWTDIRASAGRGADFAMATLPHLYEALVRNATREVSEFDVVTANLPWVPELISKEIVKPVAEVEAFSGLRSFHPALWDCTSWGGHQAGVPLYVTVEALAARSDLFETARLAFPRTPEDVIASARHLHDPKQGIAGVAWNGARGTPIASAFMFFLGDHEGAVVRPPSSSDLTRSASKERTRWRAMLQCAEAKQTLKFMRELLAVSSPNVLSFDGDRTMYEFMSGKAGMAYVWSMRAARFEFDLASRVRGRVRYLPHPNVRGMRQKVPVGGFLLAIPSNLPADRAHLAAQAIEWMTSFGARVSHKQNGLPLVPEFSVGTDIEFDATSPIVSFVKGQARDNLLDTSTRPAVPVYHWIEEILGEEIHAALRGQVSDSAALERANSRIQTFLDRMEP